MPSLPSKPLALVYVLMGLLAGISIQFGPALLQALSEWDISDRINLMNACITVIGWFIVAYLGIHLQNRLLKDNERMKVFEEIWRSRKAMSDSSAGLTSLIQSKPFIVMKPISPPAALAGDLERQAREQQRSWDYWQKYMKDLFDRKLAFEDAVLDFLRMLEMRSYAFPQLNTAIKTLLSEYRGVTSGMNEYYSFLQRLSVYQWETWDQADIERQSNTIWEKVLDFGSYASVDMMNLVHNHLVSGYFKHKKSLRKPTDPTCKVLTEGGLSINHQ